MGFWRSRMAAIERRHRARFGGYGGSVEERPLGGPRVRIRKRSALFVTGIAVVFASFAVWETVEEVQRVRDGREAVGVVVKVKRERRNTYAEVEFTTSAGQRIRTSVVRGDWRRMPKAGDRVRVRYAASHPGNAVDARLGTFRGVLPLVILWILAVLSLGATYVAWSWSRGRRIPAWLA